MHFAKMSPEFELGIKRQRSGSPDTKNKKVRIFSAAVFGGASTPVGKSAHAV